MICEKVFLKWCAIMSAETGVGKRTFSFKKRLSFKKYSKSSIESLSSEPGSPRRESTSCDSPRDSNDDDTPLEEDEKTFLVQYIGYDELKLPGFNEICDSVNKQYQRVKPELKTFQRSMLSVTKEGIELCGSDVSSSSIGELFKPRRIRYCGVDKQHQRVFSFNYQYGNKSEDVHLHVIVCRSKEDAKTVAKMLASVFKRVSKEMHQKEKEDKQKHSEGLIKLKSTSSSSSMKSFNSSRTVEQSPDCNSSPSSDWNDPNIFAQSPSVIPDQEQAPTKIDELHSGNGVLSSGKDSPDERNTAPSSLPSNRTRSLLTSNGHVRSHAMTFS